MKKRWVAGCIACVSFTALAQQPWQKIQMPTAASVQQAWMNPPSELWAGTLLRHYISNEQFVRGVKLVETMYYPASTGAPEVPLPGYLGCKFLVSSGFLKWYFAKVLHLKGVRGKLLDLNELGPAS